jgi:hypothetical protein
MTNSTMAIATLTTTIVTHSSHGYQRMCLETVSDPRASRRPSQMDFTHLRVQHANCANGEVTSDAVGTEAELLQRRLGLAPSI